MHRLWLLLYYGDGVASCKKSVKLFPIESFGQSYYLQFCFVFFNLGGWSSDDLLPSKSLSFQGKGPQLL